MAIEKFYKEGKPEHQRVPSNEIKIERRKSIQKLNRSWKESWNSKSEINEWKKKFWMEGGNKDQSVWIERTKEIERLGRNGRHLSKGKVDIKRDKGP